LGLQYPSSKRLRAENETLKQMVAELKQSQDAREPVSSGDSPSNEQLNELLRLRGEVTQLRQQTNQITALQNENKNLLVSLESAKKLATNVTVKKGPGDALPQDIHPKETWQYRGYGTPEATVESVCWAMANGDKATFLRALSPDMRAEVEKNDDGKDLMEDIKVSNSEYRILDRQQLSDDEMELTIYATRPDANGNNVGSTENTVFQRINGEWKITEKHRPK
jgi:hypothetical protein